jgi:hypothetical protein
MTTDIVVLVCGGRAFRDGDTVADALSAVHFRRRIRRVVTGGARGADELAASWALGARVGVARHPADWQAHGRAAGPIRNGEMLRAESPDLVIAFPGGRGTADMVRQARAAGIDVWEVDA